MAQTNFPDNTDYSRLRGVLTQSKINLTNNSLYQTIFDLIKSSENWAQFSRTTFATGTGGQVSNIIQAIQLALTASSATTSILTLLTADPASPIDDTWWMVRTGTSPAMQVTLKVRISGVTYEVAGITI